MTAIVEEQRTEKQGPESQEERPRSIRERVLDHHWSQQVRRILLAGVGAVALAEEEIERFVDRLVERGEIGVKDGKRLIEELLRTRREQARSQFERLDERIEWVLSRMNLATRRDVSGLREALERLNCRLDPTPSEPEA